MMIESGLMGNLNQVLVYDRVLSGEEAQNFFDTKDHPTSGLILDYSFQLVLEMCHLMKVGVQIMVIY